MKFQIYLRNFFFILLFLIFDYRDPKILDYCRCLYGLEVFLYNYFFDQFFIYTIIMITIFF